MLAFHRLPQAVPPVYAALYVCDLCTNVTLSLVVPYSKNEHSVPELIPVLGSQNAGDRSHKPGGRQPLLSTRPAVTSTAAVHHHPLDDQIILLGYRGTCVNNLPRVAVTLDHAKLYSTFAQLLKQLQLRIWFVGHCLMALSAQIGYTTPQSFQVRCLGRGQTKKSNAVFNAIFVKTTVTQLRHQQRKSF